jgi:hypothetical protein
MIMNSELPSLVTPDAATGLVLAGRIADRILTNVAEASDKVGRPGGTTYLTPRAVPREVVIGIVFHTIAASNRGWPPD